MTNNRHESLGFYRINQSQASKIAYRLRVLRSSVAQLTDMQAHTDDECLYAAYEQSIKKLKEEISAATLRVS